MRQTVGRVIHSRSRDMRPRGVALWVIQIGFSMVVLWAVIGAVLIARWHGEYSELKLALTSAVQSAAAESFQQESAGQIQLDATSTASSFETASVSALGATRSVACQPISGAPDVCAQGGWGVPVNAALAVPSVVDVNLVNNGHNHYTATAVMDPRPFWGLQLPIVAQVTTTVNLGYSNAIQGPSS
ncbi:hypothetical protein [Sulfobacillus sp. hq2]|uniref:hypothetical protein n=1 Tax=Sulfobacillus TaxID=28033 RepID=UPI000CD29F06|nr:hypothetical protein [Sulfobacillus sp. hq2]POB12329.1 hypothetical protein CO251_00230 [Sulfobacillus sp. hq2]